MLNFNNVIWKPIQGYENLYEVSNTGLIKSLERLVPNTHCSVRLVKEKLLKGRPTKTVDYLYVLLYKNNMGTRFSIHRLVAQTFLLNPLNKAQVNHKDGNKINNHESNLEWVTVSENHQHAWDTGLCDCNRQKSYERMLGTKHTTTSNYHNVSRDNTRNKWIGFIKHNGKIHFNKRFDNEIDAAMYVNTLIDKMGLTDRPKNIIK